MTSDIHPHWKSTDLRPDGDGACPARPSEPEGRSGEPGRRGRQADRERSKDSPESGGGAPPRPTGWSSGRGRADDATREGRTHHVPIVQDDDDPSPPDWRAGEQIGRAGPPERGSVRAGRGQPSRRERYRWKMILPFGAASMLLLFVFVGGVNFLRASLPEMMEEAVKPAPAAVPTPTPTPMPPVLDLGQAVPPPSVAAWPALLRINRYTVGSGLIPAFPPTEQIPVNVFRETREQLHGGAPTGRPPVRSQPQTGPAMWVLGVMSLGVLPLFLKRRVSK